MIKPLQLGICKVQFEYEYFKYGVYNKEANKYIVARRPICAIATVVANNETCIAKAICSEKDHFTYDKGRKLSLKKCFSKMTTLTKDDRRRVWDEYNKLKTGGRW